MKTSFPVANEPGDGAATLNIIHESTLHKEAEDKDVHWIWQSWLDARAAQNKAMKPAIFLWILGIVIVSLYYAGVPFISFIFDTSISSLKKQLGLVWYPFLMSSIMAGLIPLFIESLLVGTTVTWKDVLLVICLFGGTGISCNYMYVAFDLWFGNKVEVGTVAIKLFLDQFVYMLFYSGPIFVWGFRFKAVKYVFSDWWSWESFHACFPRKWLTQMFSGWIIWIPLELIIYVLPLPLQFPVMNLFSILFTLIMLFTNAAQAPKKKEEISLVNRENKEEPNQT